MKRNWLLILGLCISLVLAGCSGSSSESADEIKIGTVFPVTGNLALLGSESYRGVELAVKEANENGGIDGKKIVLENSDAVDADAAQSEATRLINKEGINLLVGSYSSGISYAATEVAERNGALYWELGAVADNVTDRNYQSVIRVNPPASSFSVQHIEFIKEVVTKQLGKSTEEIKLAIAHEDSSYGTTIAEEAKKLAETEGMEVVTVQGYASSSNDLSSVILNLKEAQPDVIIAVSYINDAILISKQAEELGYDLPVFLGSGGGHTLVDYQKSVGDLANGIFNMDFPQYAINTEYTPGLEDFVAMYEEEYGEAPRSGHSLSNYMGMKVVLQAIEEAGSTDVEKVREAAMNIKIEKGTTATGWGVEFDPASGQNTLSEPYMGQWIDGELVTVWPADVSVTEPVFGE
ncbi:ABC transporter substrate-binding protein [Lysinibacillus fusiformis]|nr:ABC transporter substrate-binding protein [Lysinibacillus fusiformis]